MNVQTKGTKILLFSI